MSSQSLRRPAVPALSALALALAAAFPAVAQTARLEPVVITGQAESTDRALRDQQAADNVVSVVRADGIGRLPDKNAAEALQRLPGVSIERDQGEGRYVRIRGLGPDLNAVTINGSLVPAPERERRAVMLDVLPSSLIRSLVVTKTLTPDMDANAIGGAVDVQILSAFDHKGRFVSFDLGAGRETNTDRTSPNGAVVWSDLFLDGKLGLAAGVSLETRKFGSDNTETGGAWDGDALEEFERRDYRITRERRGLALNAEFRPTTGVEYYARLVESRFSDDEQRLAHIIAFADPQLEGVLGDAESVREVKDRKETQSIRSLVLGTKQTLGDWTVNAQAGMSRSSENTPRHLAAAVFEADAEFADVGFSDSRRPRLIGPDAINTAAPYLLTEIELERTKVVDRENNLRLDLGRTVDLAGVATDLKFGGKTSRRVKTNEQTTWALEDFGDPPFSLSDAQRNLSGFSSGTVDYPWGAFGPSIGSGGLLGIADAVDLTPFIDEEESTINNFRIEEKVDAAYLQAAFDLGATRVLGGLRMEQTRLKAEGTSVDNGTFAPTVVERTRRDWLPGLHVRHDLDRATSVRAAWTNAVVRPTFGQLAPGIVIDGGDAAFGNPDLKPLRSSNFDLGIERALGYAGVVSLYGFHKNIRDFIYQTDLAGSGPWAAFDEAITFANGDRAKVTGLEVAYSRAFRELPAPWNGLVFSGNATFTDSKARIGAFDAGAGATAERDIPLPSQSSQVFNLMFGYETETTGVRLAVNRKSRYLLEVGDPRDASRDLYVDAQTQVDLSARYSISKSFSVVFEALNLNDSPYYVYTGSRSRNAQYETYGRTYRINLRFSL